MDVVFRMTREQYEKLKEFVKIMAWEYVIRDKGWVADKVVRDRIKCEKELDKLMGFEDTK